MKKNIQVLITDDHYIFRLAAATALESHPDIKVIGYCMNGEEAIHEAGQLHPDVIIMDIHMEPVNGIHATSTIKWRYPDIKIIGYSVEPGKTLIREMLKSGADGYITKTAPKNIIIEAVLSVVKGEKYIRLPEE